MSFCRDEIQLVRSIVVSKQQAALVQGVHNVVLVEYFTHIYPWD